MGSSLGEIGAGVPAASQANVSDAAVSVKVLCALGDQGIGSIDADRGEGIRACQSTNRR